jgi:hypothetical protein
LVIGVWGFCRFYYYLFYVLERYAGRDRKYAGIVDALRKLPQKLLVFAKKMPCLSFG